jgi:NADH:ubiquinone oxidoreductase subunit F (NADH-binding)
MADLLDDLAQGGARRRDTARLQRFLAEVSGRGACHHPDGVVRMVTSAVTTFAEDVRAHLKGRCLHGSSPSVRHA